MSSILKENNTEDRSKLLTSNELLCTIVGCMIGIGILSLPNAMAAGAGQDGWISSLIGGIYPIYIILIGSIIIKKHPKDNIMVLYKKYLGSFFGGIVNLLFAAQYIFFIMGVIAGAIWMYLENGFYFLTPFKISLIFLILTVYTASRGIKALSRVNVAIFFIIIFLILATLLEADKFNILNIQPIFGTGFGKILPTSIESAFVYSNMEILLVIHPLVNDKKNITKTAFFAIIIIMIIYTWAVLGTILFLGPDIAPKALWPFLLIYDSLKVQVLSNFKIVFIASWVVIIFKTVSNEYFVAVEVVNSIIPISKTKLCIFLSPLIFFLPLLFQNELSRRAFFSSVMPYVTIFNLFYVTLMAAIVFISILLSKKKTNKNKSGGTN